ncbi:MAG: hypothetical protein V1708_02685 [Candidatus Micrarchaeota archaeon]
MATCSAPGKILWLGAYSVLYSPNVAFATAVDARSHATAEKPGDGMVSLDAQSLGVSAEGEFRKGKFAWSGGANDKTLAFAQASIEVCAKFIGLKGTKFTGVSLTTWNDAQFGDGTKKTGLGSSAASTVAMVAAILAEYGFEASKNIEYIHKLSQLAHTSAQGGLGSGFDVACCCYGTLAYSRFSPQIIEEAQRGFGQAIESDWNCRIAPAALPTGLKIAAAFTGRPAPTVSLAKKVLALDKKSHQQFALLMEELNAQNEKAVLFLHNISDFAIKHPENYRKLESFLQDGSGKAGALALEEELTYFREFRQAFIEGRRLAKKLGELSGAPIETDEMTSLIAESESSGAYCCKLPGAGGGDSIAALCLGSKDKRRLEEFWTRKGMQVLHLTEADGGVRAD